MKSAEMLRAKLRKLHFLSVQKFLLRLADIINRVIYFFAFIMLSSSSASPTIS